MSKYLQNESTFPSFYKIITTIFAVPLFCISTSLPNTFAMEPRNLTILVRALHHKSK